MGAAKNQQRHGSQAAAFTSSAISNSYAGSAAKTCCVEGNYFGNSEPRRQDIVGYAAFTAVGC